MRCAAIPGCSWNDVFNSQWEMLLRWLLRLPTLSPDTCQGRRGTPSQSRLSIMCDHFWRAVWCLCQACDPMSLSGHVCVSLLRRGMRVKNSAGVTEPSNQQRSPWQTEVSCAVSVNICVGRKLAWHKIVDCAHRRCITAGVSMPNNLGLVAFGFGGGIPGASLHQTSSGFTTVTLSLQSLFALYLTCQLITIGMWWFCLGFARRVAATPPTPAMPMGGAHTAQHGQAGEQGQQGQQPEQGQAGEQGQKQAAQQQQVAAGGVCYYMSRTTKGKFHRGKDCYHIRDKPDVIPVFLCEHCG